MKIFTLLVFFLLLFPWSKAYFILSTILSSSKIAQNKQKQPFWGKRKRKGTYQWLFLQWHWGVASGQGVGTLHGTPCQRCLPAPPPTAWAFPCWHWDLLTWPIYHLNETKKDLKPSSTQPWSQSLAAWDQVPLQCKGLANLGWLQNIFHCVTSA